ncbi:MAG: macB 22 [Mucilaginibacter sp.]|nr:macB 22 [Mucilaginibacter sp.]
MFGFITIVIVNRMLITIYQQINKLEQRLRQQNYLSAYTFHITPYDLAFLGTIFIGLTFTLQLWFTKRINRTANRFLALALLTIVLRMALILGIDTKFGAYYPHWNWLPLQFSLALGPLLYFYVLKLTRPEYRFSRKDLLHFIPVLLEQTIPENQVLPYIAFISIVTYVYYAHRLIERFYQRIKFNGGDRYRYELRWLKRLLAGFAVLWLLWIPYAAGEYFYNHDQLGPHAYYPLYLILAVMMIWIAVAAFSRPEAGVPGREPLFLKPSPSGLLRQKGTWLKKAVEFGLFYQDADLSLASLAEALELRPPELSRIINIALKKNFSDFINEYRIREVTRKMKDPAYDRLTLLGIAFDSGFNSKTTFNRTFREIIGKSPAEYKNELKKERPFNFLEPYSPSAAVISYHEATPRWSHEKLNRNYMFKNYLKVAWRTIARNKAHSLINISGLAVGIACSLLILLWVQNELDMDAWHKNGPQLYAVYERMYFGHKASASYGTPSRTADEMKKVFPEVQYATQMDWGDLYTFQVGEKVLKINGSFAGVDYFKMFGNKLLQGNPENALNTLPSIAISHKMANQFFGRPEAAMGKNIRFENRKTLTVSAVFEDLPEATSKKFDYLINWGQYLDENQWAKDWGNAGPIYTFLQLRSDADHNQLAKKITNFLTTYNKNMKEGVFMVKLGMQPYNEMYLHGTFADDKIAGGRIEYVNLFSMIAVFILLIACINFMNLSTAKSVKRAAEIGVRKVVGAIRSVLILQFIGESLMVTIIAVGISLGLVLLFMPFFNEVTQKQIELPFGDIGFWLKLLGLTLITGLVAGSYPALFLSSFNPVKVLKGTIRLGRGAALFRKSLVVFQFVLSVVLIIGTLIISKQINFIQSKNLGYDRENLIYLPLDGDLPTKYGTLRDEALRQPGIQAITRISQTPTDIQNGTGDVMWTGKDPNNSTKFTQTSVGYNFIKTMKLKMLAGRDYSKDFSTDSAGYVINETALKIIGYQNPIGQSLTFWGKKGTIIGVVKDFHFTSLHDPIQPLVIRFGEKEQYGAAVIRTQAGHTKQVLGSLETIWKELNPSFPFNYTFADEEYQKLYQNEQVIGKLSNVFAFLAVFISCLGLLGLAMFTTEQRVKEIGIRKVLGASVASLFASLSKEFMILVILALLIASPIAYLAMNKWLQGYYYRTELSWWIFALSAFIALLITLITISFQTLKASMINPVKSLRSE